MPNPIILPPSNDHDALANAIQQAIATNAMLLLEPGVHFTRPGRALQIAVGATGLRIGSTGASPLPIASNVPKAIVQRPEKAVIPETPDFNFGLFFVPDSPTDAEEAQITWQTATDPHGQKFEFGIVIRGRIEIAGLLVDCNMHKQGLELLKKDAGEHSAMLGFSGLRYNAKHQPGPLHRFIYVGFESVALSDMGFVNGGFADDVWLTNGDGGAFHPHLESFSIEHVASASRINPRRATLAFSALAQNIRIHDADIYRLLAEQDDDWRDAPRRDPVFSKSVWDLAQVKADLMGFAMKRKVMTLKANALEAIVGFGVDYCGGVIGNSSLNIEADQDSRLIELDEMNFDRVTWHLHANQAGAVTGLQLRASNSETCVASFTNNTFRVIGTATSGQLIGSDHSQTQPVTLTFRGCSYQPSFGSAALAGTAIARVNAIGTWTFSQIDLNGLDPNQALPKSPDPAVIRLVV